jgi:hypothetical protein
VPLRGIILNKILMTPETWTKTGVKGEYPWGRHGGRHRAWSIGKIVDCGLRIDERRKAVEDKKIFLAP